MKLKRSKLLFAFLLTGSLVFAANNAEPIVTITNIVFDRDNSLVTIDFNVTDADNTEVEIILSASPDGGAYYETVTTNVTGTGTMAVGSGKQIVWTLPAILDYKFRVIANDGEEYDIQSIVDQVDSNQIEEYMTFIASKPRRYLDTRRPDEDQWVDTAAANHLEKTRLYIKQQFWKAGHDIVWGQRTLGKYRQIPWSKDIEGENINAKQIGLLKSDTTVLVGAHIDSSPWPFYQDTTEDYTYLNFEPTFEQQCPGADDNATGCAAFLEASRVLGKYHFEKNIRYSAFDHEELGLDGSLDFVNGYSNPPVEIEKGYPDWETIQEAIIIEMMGYYRTAPFTQGYPDNFTAAYPNVVDQLAANEFRGDFMMEVANEESKGLRNRFYFAAQEYVPDLKIISLTAAGWAPATEGGEPIDENQDIRRSDHSPFWDAHIPAIMIGAGAQYRNENYHSEHDALDSINFSWMETEIKALVASLITEAGIMHVGVDEASITTGINENEISLDGNFSLSPNPAESFVSLTYNGLTESNLNLELMNSIGQVFYTNQLNRESGTININTENMNRGLYLLTIKGEQKQKTLKLILK